MSRRILAAISFVIIGACSHNENQTTTPRNTANAAEEQDLNKTSKPPAMEPGPPQIQPPPAQPTLPTPPEPKPQTSESMPR